MYLVPCIKKNRDEHRIRHDWQKIIMWNIIWEYKKAFPFSHDKPTMVIHQQYANNGAIWKLHLLVKSSGTGSLLPVIYERVPKDFTLPQVRKNCEIE